MQPSDDNGKASGSVTERAFRETRLWTLGRKKTDSSRVFIRITSYRRRLLDPDNLCAKYFIDALRYSGFIRDDTPEEITYQISQEKVLRSGDERTAIEIIRNLPIDDG